jgi:UDP-glucose 4-epimerase
MTHDRITGRGGFIGSQLMNLLLEAGHQVVTIHGLSNGSLENIASIQHHSHYKFVRETIMNALVLDRLTSEPEVVIHLADTV